MQVNKYRSYMLIRDLEGLKWFPILKVWEQLQDEQREETQNSFRLNPLAILIKIIPYNGKYLRLKDSANHSLSEICRKFFCDIQFSVMPHPLCSWT